MTHAVAETTPDAELVRAARLGQPDAYAELVHRWAARVLAVCHARVRRRDIAEELAQETLLRGLQALPTLESDTSFGPWLRGIAQRVCLDWLKAKQSGQITFSELTNDHTAERLWASPSEVTVDHTDELNHLMSIVEQLPEKPREVLMLYYYNDMTYRELADLLGVSPATINARLTKARTMLREKLGEARGATS